MLTFGTERFVDGCLNFCGPKMKPVSNFWNLSLIPGMGDSRHQRWHHSVRQRDQN